MLAQASKFLPIHQRIGKLIFLSLTCFHILSYCKDNLSSLVCVQECQFLIKLPVFKGRNVRKCLCNKYVPFQVLGILFSSLNEGKSCKFSLGILMKGIGTRYYIRNTKTCSVYHWNHRNKTENKCSSLQQRQLFICLFHFKNLFVCVKYSTCLRMAIPVYCFNIFGSIFGVLFCVLIKKLILDIKLFDKV